MRIIASLIGMYVMLCSTSACKKETRTETLLSSPVSSLSKMAGMRQWHGQYYHQEYNADSTHIIDLQNDTTLSFALTIANDSTILYNLFNGSDSLFYVRTNEFGKYIYYTGSKFQGNVDLFYYYSTGKIELEMDGLNISGLFVTLKLSSP